MLYIKSMKAKDLIKQLKQNGWELARVNGSHHIFKREDKTVVVPVHNTDLKPGTLNSILKQAGLK